MTGQTNEGTAPAVPSPYFVVENFTVYYLAEDEAGKLMAAGLLFASDESTTPGELETTALVWDDLGLAGERAFALFNVILGRQAAAPAKSPAVFTVDEHEDGRITYGVDHSGGGFMVSSPEVGHAIVAFLEHATTRDMHILHGHLLHAYLLRANEDAKLPDDDEPEPESALPEWMRP